MLIECVYIGYRQGKIGRGVRSEAYLLSACDNHRLFAHNKHIMLVVICDNGNYSLQVDRTKGPYRTKTVTYFLRSLRSLDAREFDKPLIILNMEFLVGKPPL